MKKKGVGKKIVKRTVKVGKRVVPTKAPKGGSIVSGMRSSRFRGFKRA